MTFEDEYGPPPDGYAYIGGGPAMQLIDPVWCPTGHPAELIRRSTYRCQAHGNVLHPSWTCSCGQEIWRVAGEFAGELRCR
ncbi:hypothetical protein GCM10010199_63090 [Dactylosporangium roseum]